MKVVIQRVTKASVTIDGEKTARINKGLVILLGISKLDTSKDVEYLTDKIVNLRIFSDKNKNINLSSLDVSGELLIVSQFTLYGDCHKGNRPDFMQAAPGKIAEQLYNEFIEKLKKYPLKIMTGKFGAMMQVEIHNDGPVTLIVESKRAVI